MGMYDTISVNQSLRCPKCGFRMRSSDWQTKNIDSYLCCHLFYFPDIIDDFDANRSRKKWIRKHKNKKLTKEQKILYKLMETSDSSSDRMPANFDLDLITQCPKCDEFLLAMGKVRKRIICEITLPAGEKVPTQVIGTNTPPKELFKVIKELRDLKRTHKKTRDILACLMFMVYNESRVNLAGLKELENELKLNVRKTFQDFFSIKERDWPTSSTLRLGSNFNDILVNQLRELLDKLWIKPERPKPQPRRRRK